MKIEIRKMKQGNFLEPYFEESIENDNDLDDAIVKDIDLGKMGVNEYVFLEGVVSVGAFYKTQGGGKERNINYIFNGYQCSFHIKHVEVNVNAQEDDQNAFLNLVNTTASFEPYIGIINTFLSIMNDLDELTSNAEFEKAYDENYAYSWSSMINGDIY